MKEQGANHDVAVVSFEMKVDFELLRLQIAALSELLMDEGFPLQFPGKADRLEGVLGLLESIQDHGPPP